MGDCSEELGDGRRECRSFVELERQLLTEPQ